MSRIKLIPAVSPTGERWVQAREDERTVWIHLSDFRLDGTAAINKVAKAGINIVGRDQARDLVQRVAALTDFPLWNIIERPGWSGAHFALNTGEIFSPAGVEPAAVVFETVPTIPVAGTHREWRRQVASPLAEHPIAAFLMMVVFAPPLLRLSSREDNFGFEIVGRRGKGKSTFQLLASSAVGIPSSNIGHKYVVSMDATRVGIESTLEAHSDMALIIDEAGLFAPDDPPRTRGRKMRDIALKLGTGEEKRKYGNLRPQSYRTIFVISGNEPLASLTAGLSGGINEAAADRLITLPIGDREFGLLEHCPSGFDDVRDFVKHLMACATRQHGTAIRAFLAGLVQHRHENEEGLRKRIDKLLKGFRRRVGVRKNDGSAGRVADAFGLVMVAGRLAQYYKVLPKSFDCAAAAEFCYRLAQGTRVAEETFVEQLIRISRGSDVIPLEKSMPFRSNTQLDETTAFLHRGRRGRSELIFWPRSFQRQFPNFVRLLRRPEVDRMLIKEKFKGELRSTTKRSIRPGKMERVYCFVLPS